MLKAKNSKWTIDLIGSCAIDLIAKEVSGYRDEWLIDTSRQDNSITHKNTQMYQLVFSDYRWVKDHFGDFEISVVNKLKTVEAIEQLNDIYKYLEEFFDGIVCRSEIIKMFPNTAIRKHVDGGYWLQYARRCHIPLITNPGVTFTVEDTTVHMETGKIYEINNALRHSVHNPTDFNRVHLIIDIMPKSVLEQQD